jgi:hypothetical protein
MADNNVESIAGQVFVNCFPVRLLCLQQDILIASSIIFSGMAGHVPLNSPEGTIRADMTQNTAVGTI